MVKVPLQIEAGKNGLTLEGRVIKAVPIGTPQLLFIDPPRRSEKPLDAIAVLYHLFVGEAEYNCPPMANAFLFSESIQQVVRGKREQCVRAVQYYCAQIK